MNRILVLLVTFAFAAMMGCESAPEDQASTDNTPTEAHMDEPADDAMPEPNKELEQAMAMGLTIEDHVEGTGAEAEAGKIVHVHYTGWLFDDSKPENKGTKFDSSHDRGEPIVFPLGAGRVIKGWDLGFAGMKEGGQRTLTIPSELGYGERGTPGGPIPGGATLLFDVELVQVQ